MAFPHDGKKFPKGQSGNPNGRPKNIPKLRETFEAIIHDMHSEPYENVIQAIAGKLIERALSGDIRAIEFTFNLLYPKGMESIENDKNFTIVWGTIGGNKNEQN